MHDGYSTRSGNYYCDILYFNTGIWWRYDDNTITKLTFLPDNVYTDSFNQKIAKRVKNLRWQDQIILCPWDILKQMFLYKKVMHFFSLSINLASVPP